MSMQRKRNLVIGSAFVAALVALGSLPGRARQQARTLRDRTVQAPMFEVDPLWPKPLPNHWLLGMDHRRVGRRPGPRLDHPSRRGDAAQQREGRGAESADRRVLPRRAAGAGVRSGGQPGQRHWGGPGQGYEWPESNHGIHVDYKGNVWIGGNGEKDAHILKFTKDGKFLMQVGHAGGKNAGSNDLENFGRVAKIWVDPKTNEAYIADGYLQQARRRARRRHRQDEALLGRVRQQARRRRPRATTIRTRRRRSSSATRCTASSARTTACVYVCDRQGDRVQVFHAGRQVREGSVLREGHARLGLGLGHRASRRTRSSASSSWPTARTRRCASSLRETLEEITNFGDGGRQPGQFYGVHSIATDSKGNLYTTETYEGKRVQKFVYKGIGAVRAASRACSGRAEAVHRCARRRRRCAAVLRGGGARTRLSRRSRCASSCRFRRAAARTRWRASWSRSSPRSGRSR